MRIPLYTVRVLTSKAQKAWQSLTPEVRAQVELEIRTFPKHNPLSPKLHDHLEGKVFGVNRRCHYEYKGLRGGRRVFYTVHDAARRVEIEYIGPHP